MTIDNRRMLALFMDGVICTGPLLHYIYEFYEWILPTHDKDIIRTDGEKDTLAGTNDLGEEDNEQEQTHGSPYSCIIRQLRNDICVHNTVDTIHRCRRIEIYNTIRWHYRIEE